MTNLPTDAVEYCIQQHYVGDYEGHRVSTKAKAQLDALVDSNKRGWGPRCKVCNDVKPTPPWYSCACNAPNSVDIALANERDTLKARVVYLESLDCHHCDGTGINPADKLNEHGECAQCMGHGSAVSLMDDVENLP